MKPENESIIKEIVGSIRRLVRAVSLDSARNSRQFSLTAPQSGVLRSLATNGPISSASLSRDLYVTPSNITGIIDRLEKKGLVTRIKKEGDRRVALLTLTEAGEKLSRDVPDPIESKLISELSDLNPKQVAKLRDAMKVMLNLMDAEGVEDSPLH
jgi:MarR family transcriptional regulator, organic hydroperoxide resistance regulator